MRDIGELLSASEYDDDLNLNESVDEETVSDREFIVSDHEDEGYDGDSDEKYKSESREQSQADEDYDGDEEKYKSESGEQGQRGALSDVSPFFHPKRA
jgi:hypothetical protein